MEGLILDLPRWPDVSLQLRAYQEFARSVAHCMILRNHSYRVEECEGFYLVYVGGCTVTKIDYTTDGLRVQHSMDEGDWDARQREQFLADARALILEAYDDACQSMFPVQDITQYRSPSTTERPA
jgi:hypothetical protein